jgi:hypothetical protein
MDRREHVRDGEPFRARRARRAVVQGAGDLRAEAVERRQRTRRVHRAEGGGEREREQVQGRVR